MSIWPSFLGKLAGITTSAAPTLGKHNSYSAAAGALAPTLPPLTTGTVATALAAGQLVRVKVSKSKADTSANAVTVTCAASDTFEGGATVTPLTVAGEKLTLVAGTIPGASGPVWIVEEHTAPRDSLDVRYPPQAGIGYGSKTGYFNCGNAMDQSTSITNGLFRVPMRVPVATVQWRIHWRNASVKDGVYPTGTVNLTAFFFGMHLLNTADGTPSGNFAAAPTQVDPASTAVDAAEHVSAWVTDPTLQMQPNVEYLLSYGFTASGGQVMIRTSNLTSFKNAGSASAGTQTVTGMTVAGVPGFGELWIEYQFVGANKRGLYLGDSLTDGKNAGQLMNYPNAHALPNGIVPIVCGYSGITAQTYVALGSTHYAFTKWGLGAGGVVPDFSIIQLGINDVTLNRTLAQIKADLMTIIGFVRGFGVQRIYLDTVAPSAGLTQAQEEVRTLLNAWIRNKPAAIAGFFDIDRALRDVSNATADVQTITLTGAPTGGTLALTGGYLSTATTAALAYNASTATVQAAVRGLPGLYNAVVTGSAGAWVVTNPSSLGYVPSLTADGSLLTGGTTPTASVAHTTTGNVPLDPMYDSGDHLHWTAAGYAKAASVIPAALAPAAAT